MILYFQRMKRTFTFYIPRYSDSFAQGFQQLQFFFFLTLRSCVLPWVYKRIINAMLPCFEDAQFLPLKKKWSIYYNHQSYVYT